MKEISEYNVLEATSKSDLCSKVQIDINHGWQPHGDINIIFASGVGMYTRGGTSAWKYSQVMVKYIDVQPTAIIHMNNDTSEEVFKEIKEKLDKSNHE